MVSSGHSWMGGRLRGRGGFFCATDDGIYEGGMRSTVH